MIAKTIPAFLEKLRHLSGEQHSIVEAVRAIVKEAFPAVSEEMKYGGILFSIDGVQFCGVFAYAQHVSVEFRDGAKIPDAHGHLEGSGKGRRHIKLHTLGDIKAKNLAHYLPLALEAGSSSSP